MKKSHRVILVSVVTGLLSLSNAFAQEKKLERIRVGGALASTTQMSLWFAKEGNFYDKQGLNVEAISIPGSSLALQAMLSGELPIIQLGGAASIQANLAGADTVSGSSEPALLGMWVATTQPSPNTVYAVV